MTNAAIILVATVLLWVLLNHAEDRLEPPEFRPPKKPKKKRRGK